MKLNELKMSTEILTWNETFLNMAETIAKRSKDPTTQVGAVIVDEEKRVVGVGYNGFPRTPKGVQNDLIFPWNREGVTRADTKHPYVIHSEVNAILNATTNDLQGSTLYVTKFPCAGCAKLICQKGIGKIYFKGDIDMDPNGRYCMPASIKMFEACDIDTKKLE